MLDLKPVVHAVLEDYTLRWDGTHGVSHWARVLESGLRLADATGACSEIVQLFAVLHDARRARDCTDPLHGQRGAELAKALRGEWLDLSDSDFDLLYTACADHAYGTIDGDITIQACWDADRLDLGRTGMVPDPGRLCTEAAKTLIDWADARACRQVVPEFVQREWEIDLSKPSG